jgi:sodium-dependent dicarboxylate transporter 2/3/5
VLLAGPALAVAMALSPAPAGLSAAGWATAAVGVMIAFWWLTEAAPLATTALLPLVLFPIFGIDTLAHTAGAYAHPLIFLFLGGFLMARAMEMCGLNRRLAFALVRMAGDRPAGVIAALMGATAFLSMWISNTATIMVMLPIAISLLPTADDENRDPSADRFAPALLLGIAYAATVGGMATLIGTPPNALFAGYMQDSHGIRIGFADWMLVGLPVTLVMLPVTWFLLVKVLFRMPADAHPVAAVLNAPAGPLTQAQRRVGLVVAGAAVCWLLRPVAAAVWPDLPISDTTIAVAAAMLLFLLPGDREDGRSAQPLLTWSAAAKIRWDVLILFGGGLALAAAISQNGLAAWIGGGLSVLGELPVFLLILLATSVIVYLGELASNTAMAAVFLPVAAATAVAMGQPPLFLTLPIALAASLGFMLPVATPPNAIVFGSGRVTSRQMLGAGAILNVIGILVAAVVSLTIGRWVF